MHKCLVVIALVVAAVLAAAPAGATTPRHHLAYAAVGDSISEGVGTSDWVKHDDGTWERVAEKFSYPEQAGIKAYARGASCISDDCGTGGIGQWLPPLLNTAPRRLKTLVMESGVNDLVLGVTAAQLITRAREFRRQMAAIGYRVIFATIVPPPQGSVWAVIQPERSLYNEWVRTQGTYVDYARALQCGRWLCAQYVSDTQDVHVGNLGATVMADTLLAWVERDS